MSAVKPWAVLLCKFKDDLRGFVTINVPDTIAMFTDLQKESVTAFWRDVSYGALDLSGSKAFGWLTLQQNQSDYKGSGPNPAGRQDLVDWARTAADANGIDLSSFYGVAVFMSTPTDLWGSTGEVVCDVASPLAAILQEFGHGFGQTNHSRSVAKPTDYNDPFCVMSSMQFGAPNSDPTLDNPTFSGEFGASGPLLCSPYVDAEGWLTANRQLHLATDGSSPQTSTLRLSPLGDQSARHPQAAVLDFHAPSEATYYIEYRSSGWDRGLAQKQVVIHQRLTDGYAYYAGNLPVSIGEANGTTLLPAQLWRDPTFDLSVRVSRLPDPNDDSVEIIVGPRGAPPHQPFGINFTLAHDLPEVAFSQDHWRFCTKCHSMFYDGDPTNKGACASGGGHEAYGFMFFLAHDLINAADSQNSWRFCDKCWSMFFDGDPNDKGRCQAGGVHQSQGFNFFLRHDLGQEPPFHQEGWRFCSKCSSLFYAGVQTQGGRCVAGGAHEAFGFVFYLPHDLATPPQGQDDWRFCEKCREMYFDGNPEWKGLCPAGEAHAGFGFNFFLEHDIGSNATHQDDWRFCQKCASIYYQGDNPDPKGVCPAGGQHSLQGFNFSLSHDIPVDADHQDGWRFCNKCWAMYYDAGDPLNKGFCPG
jgi:hypothetical protein